MQGNKPCLFQKSQANFLTFDEQRKKDLETKNTYLKVDLENPFSNTEIDSKTTEWRRYWNINDDPEFKEKV